MLEAEEDDGGGLSSNGFVCFFPFAGGLMGADLTTGAGTCAGKKVPFKHAGTRPLIHKHLHALTHEGPLNTRLIETLSADFCPRRADVSGHRVHPGMFAALPRLRHVRPALGK